MRGKAKGMGFVVVGRGSEWMRYERVHVHGMVVWIVANKPFNGVSVHPLTLPACIYVCYVCIRLAALM